MPPRGAVGASRLIKSPLRRGCVLYQSDGRQCQCYEIVLCPSHRILVLPLKINPLLSKANLYSTRVSISYPRFTTGHDLPRARARASVHQPRRRQSPPKNRWHPHARDLIASREWEHFQSPIMALRYPPAPPKRAWLHRYCPRISTNLTKSRGVARITRLSCSPKSPSFPRVGISFATYAHSVMNPRRTREGETMTSLARYPRRR
mmetsp:Transcript_5464/g.12455  ORF Transcript_5464/g.12455 Transcript_5464/m.12455 type:complete len:205 (-) Transcript_5464:930-1544(-)